MEIIIPFFQSMSRLIHIISYEHEFLFLHGEFSNPPLNFASTIISEGLILRKRDLIYNSNKISKYSCSQASYFQFPQ